MKILTEELNKQNLEGNAIQKNLVSSLQCCPVVNVNVITVENYHIIMLIHLKFCIR